MNNPLVSILVPNFNHAHFLAECLDSLFAQTYENKEIIFLDNQSNDDSLTVARRYLERGLVISRNAVNVLNHSYRILSEQLCRGDYLMLVGADDALAPTCVEKAVAVMQTHPTVGFVHVERDFFDAQGHLTELEPFFNCSFVAPGRSVMPIFMVTPIAHPAQGIVRRNAFVRVEGYQREIDHMNADRSLWFYLSAVSDYAYLREKLCRIRFSQKSQTSQGIKNFQHPLLYHMMINEFARYAEQRGFAETLARKGEALARLSRDCLTWAAIFLKDKDFCLARSYLDYARLLNRAIAEEPVWKSLTAMCHSRRPDPVILADFNVTYAAHKRNYVPPAGYIHLNLEADHG